MTSRNNEFLPKRKRDRVILKKSIKYVIIGGGIAGISCAKEITRLTNNKVIIINNNEIIKEAVCTFKTTQHINDFTIYEHISSNFTNSNPLIDIIINKVISLDLNNKLIYLSNNEIISYDKLCICSGAKPNLIINNENVIGIRDNDSVIDLCNRIKSARNIIILGNGGIALELAHLLTFCNIDWIIKDNYIGSAFFDATSSDFIKPLLNHRIMLNNNIQRDYIRATNCNVHCNHISNAALGPNWDVKSDLLNQLPEDIRNNIGYLHIHYNQQFKGYYDNKSTNWFDSNHKIIEVNDNAVNLSIYPIYIITDANNIIGADFIISATGVIPNTSFLSNLSNDILFSEDGSIRVNNYMQIKDNSVVFAAGDCCYYDTQDHNHNMELHINTWFQMKLWSQASYMGTYAGQCMATESHNCHLINNQIFFEIFAHITRFFGYKVVLLGRYNAQGFSNDIQRINRQFTIRSDESVNNNTTSDTITQSNNDVEIYVRQTVNVEYIKLTIYKGKVIGALLIGDTDLEEVFENLILNRVDISRLGINILNPNIDIEDYFD